MLEGLYATIFGSAGAILGTVLTITFSTGIMKEKVIRMERDMEDMKTDAKGFVTQTHFQAVVDPMRRTLDSVQKDIKEILRAVSKQSRKPYQED